MSAIKISLIQRFNNLPITRKTQSITLLIFLSLGGITLLGAKVLENSLRSQLQAQTKSRLTITELNYRNGIEQMEMGFASLANNPSLLKAAQYSAEGNPLPAALKQDIKTLLQKETRLGQIEYATLVGKDSRIIVNANRDRSGQKFDPNRLVSQVLLRPRQISSSELVSWQELRQESPVLSAGQSEQDGLIRYTLTPIKSPENGKVLAVLVAGNLVNGKDEIVEKTVDASAGEGYSAIYLHNSDGKFSLAISVEKNDLRQSSLNVPLADKSLLEQAVNADGRTVPETGKYFQGTLDNHTYTLAAKALPNYQGEPVAVLVYGDPETALKRIIQTSLLTQGLLSSIVLLLVPLLAWIIGRSISRPITELQRVTAEFAQGNYHERAILKSKNEVGQLAENFNEMADSIESNSCYLVEQAEMFRFLSRLSIPEHLDESTLESIFNQALKEARQIVQTDRILIYRFYRDGRGYVAYESVESSWQSAIGYQVESACLGPDIIEAYRQDRMLVIPNVIEAQNQLHPDHYRLLERLQVKASMVLPILNQKDVFGLLIAHQCSTSREWQETEVNFLKQLVSQFQVILERVTLSKQRTLESRLSMRLKDITLKISRVFQEQELFDMVVDESRRALGLDRAIVYRFNVNWQGTIIAESVEQRFPFALGARIGDPCFADKFVEKYRNGRVQAIPDIYAAGLTPCHLQQLEPFAVKANLVTPILVAGELHGLLIGHQCRSVYYWEQSEIDFLTQVAIQVGIALERANLLAQQKTAEFEQRQAKELLQKRAIELLMEVDPIRNGDLSIRATVTSDEIGTIADSYNATIESLRKIVTQVQSVTEQLSDTTHESGSSIHSLALQTSSQVGEINAVLKRVEIMMEAIDGVSANAQQALATVQSTLLTVETSEAVMNQTVEGMSSIQDTVTQTAQKIASLNESSQKISKVVNLISRFAAQTHLLALKASIEAARAGEEGRGFAVIADEVRTLAAQSAEATAEIESLVVSIQNETKEVAATMKTGTEQVMMGSQLVEETCKGLNQITLASQEINQLVSTIAQSAVRQTQTGQVVRRTMTEVSAISQTTSTSAQEVSASFETLLKATESLSDSVGQFKVK